MQKLQMSLCIRCGNVRVFEKTWKEYVGTSVLTYTRSVCADAACQKIVDSQIAAQKEKRAFHAQKRFQSQHKRGRLA